MRRYKNIWGEEAFMDKQEIENVLYRIMQKFVPEAALPELWRRGRRLPLTGEQWDLDAIQMTYLFFEVERAFSILINPDQLTGYRFNSVEGIIDIVYTCLQQSGARIIW